MKKFVLRTAIATMSVVLAEGSCGATQLVYHPANPTFGGNPLNGTYLLSQAQAQGLGAKSGAAGPDLSGLENSLNNIGAGGGSGSVIVIDPTGGQSGAGTGNPTSANSRNIP